MNSISSKTSKYYVASGIILLLLGSFLDNLRGPLLPILTRDLGITYQDGSWLFVAGNLVSVLVTFFLIPTMKVLSERRTCLLAIVISVTGCLFALFVHGFWSFIGFALLLGMATGSIGAMCNIMAMIGAKPGRQRQSLSILHMSYGVGAFTAPLILVGLRDLGFPWTASFLILLVPFIGLFGLIFAKIPEQGPISPASETGFMFASDQLLPLLIFGFYVVGEVMTSSWLVAYLVEDKKMSLAAGARQFSLFFLVMAISRFSNLAIRSAKLESFVMFGSLVLPLLIHGIARFWDLPEALPLAGIVGCFFPLFLSRLKDRFSDRWREMTIWIVVFLQIFAGLGHFFTGRITALWNIGIAFYIPMVALLIAVLLFAVFWVQSDGISARKHATTG
jgi:fucose permease